MTRKLILITIDGVLAHQGDEDSFAASKVIEEGALIYRAFTSIAKVALLSLQNYESDRTKVEYWLQVHGLTDHVWLLFDPWPTDVNRSVDMVVNEVRRSGGLGLAVESDSRRAARLLHHGVSVSVLGRPEYTRREFRPDVPRTARPWEEVIEELDEQRAINSEDDRITADVAGQRYE